jgi:hypothetical protein
VTILLPLSPHSTKDSEERRLCALKEKEFLGSVNSSCDRLMADKNGKSDE